jgi:hypothetical protein
VAGPLDVSAAGELGHEAKYSVLTNAGGEWHVASG